MCSPRVSNVLWLLLLLSPNLWTVEARWTARPRRTTTTTTTAQPDRHQHVHHWPPLVAPKLPESQPESQDESIRLIDDFDRRSPDGQHEYRYQLSNGDTRYERSYWLPVGKNWVLARRGFYSVPLPGAQYSTVFYRADHHGYHVDTHTLSEEQPLLPRSLELPHDLQPAAATKSTPAAKRNSISVPERNETATAKDVEMEMEMQMVGQREQQVVGESRAKVQAEQQQQQQRNSQSQKQKQKQKQNKTKPSTVAKVEDILATPAVDNDDDVALDDDDVRDGELSIKKM